MHCKRLVALLITVCALIVTGGCQTGQQSMINTSSDDLSLTEAALPNYLVGEYFSYDDGTTTVVMAVSNEQVTWRYNNGATRTGYRNFARQNSGLEIVDRLHSMVNNADCYKLKYDNPDQAVKLLEDAFGLQTL